MVQIVWIVALAIRVNLPIGWPNGIEPIFFPIIVIPIIDEPFVGFECQY
jgi:hypothetical protein